MADAEEAEEDEEDEEDGSVFILFVEDISRWLGTEKGGPLSLSASNIQIEKGGRGVGHCGT